MTAFITTARLLLRIAFLIMLLLGLYIWYAGAGNLVNIHMMIGGIFVLLLWTLAIAGARAGASKGLAALTFAWGLVIPAVGMGQLNWMPGSLHWIVRLCHLLVAMIAMPLAERVARQALERQGTGAGRAG